MFAWTGEKLSHNFAPSFNATTIAGHPSQARVSVDHAQYLKTPVVLVDFSIPSSFTPGMEVDFRVEWISAPDSPLSQSIKVDPDGWTIDVDMRDITSKVLRLDTHRDTSDPSQAFFAAIGSFIAAKATGTIRLTVHHSFTVTNLAAAHGYMVHASLLLVTRQLQVVRHRQQRIENMQLVPLSTDLVRHKSAKGV